MAQTAPAPAAAPPSRGVRPGPRFSVSRGLVTISAATVALFIASALIASTSVSGGALRGMLPFAAVLAIVGDRPDAGGPAGRHRPLGARRRLAGRRHRHPLARRATTASCSAPSLFALGVAVAGGPAQRLPRRAARLLNPIVATLGHECAALRRGAGHLRWRPASYDRPPRRRSPAVRASGSRNAVYIAVVVVAVTSVVVKLTVGGPTLRGGRRQPRSGVGGRPAGRTFTGRGLRLGAAALLAGRRHARRHHRPAHRLPGQRLPAALASPRSSSAAPRCSVGGATWWPPPSPRSSSASSSSSCWRWA